ncbi:TDP-N-acetylfucosamine:lipid II N-acetylfucosaminyltransferase [Sphingobacterium sp.]|jgi:hypothetical protein|uniref:TDP-N-acetylfucosamine:lipid II N-acetylfucosaminyltransferase n=1 Tax=Sphingobacterium sp. TaxID=341027 RepID=UPI00289E0F0E|nr:TDP-N-acetylfucosamine:lipid II N-acetylfucosaminyltransferase [Sphingobacterium sp.]
MNVHFFHDDKFTNGAMEQFETAYPGQNIYIILLYDQRTLKYTVANAYTHVFHIRDLHLLKNLKKIISSNISDCRLLIHFMDDFKAALSNKLLDKFSHLQFYWIFYGGDLYDYLSRYEGYQIFDAPNLLPTPSRWERVTKSIKYLMFFGMSQKTAKTKAFKRLDYFCFWNEYDYTLFISKVDSPAHYKNFIYYKALGDSDHVQIEKKNIIMVNHAASFTGNHLFVIEKLAKLQASLKDFQLLLPLSYGNKEYAKKVIQQAKDQLDMNVKPLTDFLPLSEYQSILSEVKIAIFGMRRQEAAGNIFQLLNMGAKIFLRKDNTLLSWLKKRNFIVFCIEDDEKELENLQALSLEQMSYNSAQYKRYFNASNYQEMMQQLFSDEAAHIV